MSCYNLCYFFHQILMTFFFFFTLCYRRFHVSIFYMYKVTINIMMIIFVNVTQENVILSPLT